MSGELLSRTAWCISVTDASGVPGAQSTATTPVEGGPTFCLIFLAFRGLFRPVYTVRFSSFDGIEITKLNDHWFGRYNSTDWLTPKNHVEASFLSRTFINKKLQCGRCAFRRSSWMTVSVFQFGWIFWANGNLNWSLQVLLIDLHCLTKMNPVHSSPLFFCLCVSGLASGFFNALIGCPGIIAGGINLFVSTILALLVWQVKPVSHGALCVDTCCRVFWGNFSIYWSFLAFVFEKKKKCFASQCCATAMHWLKFRCFKVCRMGRDLLLAQRAEKNIYGCNAE